MWFKFNGHQYQTKVKKEAGLKVSWTLEDDNLFTLKPKIDSTLELYTYDYDQWKYDDLIGKAEVIHLAKLLETTEK